MNLLPDEDMSHRASINLAPMVDFLFLILAVFAVLSITSSKMFVEEIELAQTDEVNEAISYADQEPLHLFVNKEGEYILQKDNTPYKFFRCQHLNHELQKMRSSGELPYDPKKVSILLHIDKQAEWESVMQLLLSLQNGGYQVQTVYSQSA
jgi:biopolymer transport protein ExbD